MTIHEPTIELLTRYRRDLHQIPEVDFDLPETLAYVLDVLEGIARETNGHLGREVVRLVEPCRSTICCIFDRESEHATAIRSDMDALPVTERTDSPFASRHAGRMHACGHDGHMSMVLGLAGWLALHLGELPHTVVLVFQPAEETTGGAKVVCESGILDELCADRIFGFHLWPDLPHGQVASRPGPLLAAANETTVTVRGRASHIARAEQGADALLAACHVVDACYGYMDERQAEEPCLLRFGHMTSGSVRNQISDASRIEGSLRTFSIAMGERCRRELPECAERAAELLGCTAEVGFSEGYPPVVNDEGLFGKAAVVLPDLGDVPKPLLIAEDFAWYQRCLPGVFLLLGTGTGIPLHSDTFAFDEAVLMRGVEAYERLVMLA